LWYGERLTAPLLFGIPLLAFVVYLNERHGLLRRDAFATTAHRVGAYAWLGILLIGMSAMVMASSANPTSAEQLANVSFWSLFTFHVVLIVFLAGWWLLANRPPLPEFLSLGRGNYVQSTLLGISVGFGGWVLTITLALLIGAILMGAGVMPETLKPSPMIPWMAGFNPFQKLLVVFMAMTVEEAFFRGWLQKRTGLLISTVIFAIAHAGYGQPFMLIGVTIISLVIGITYYRTKDLWPCVVAHGVFDAIQIFVIVPTALKFMS
jgi:membrane protease YdiL (CAAX protease family)